MSGEWKAEGALPCRFCGSKNITHLSFSGFSHLRCDDCMIHGPADEDSGYDGAVEAWNAMQRGDRRAMSNGREV